MEGSESEKNRDLDSKVALGRGSRVGGRRGDKVSMGVEGSWDKLDFGVEQDFAVWVS